MSNESKQIIAELKEKIKQLETELYFCYRNNKIEKSIGDNYGSK